MFAVRGKGRGAGAGARTRGRVAKRGRGNSRNSEPIDMRKSHDTVTARVLSASRNKINELRNKVIVPSDIFTPNQTAHCIGPIF